MEAERTFVILSDSEGSASIWARQYLRWGSFAVASNDTGGVTACFNADGEKRMGGRGYADLRRRPSRPQDDKRPLREDPQRGTRNPHKATCGRNRGGLRALVACSNA